MAHTSARGSGLRRHCGNFFEFQANHEHGMRRDASPADEIPLRANEIDFGTRVEIEDLTRLATIEPLRQHQKRLGAEILAVGRSPNRDIEGFLLDLIGDDELAQKSARLRLANVKGIAVTVGDDASSGRDQDE
jgi:hypothetical protein